MTPEQKMTIVHAILVLNKAIQPSDTQKEGTEQFSVAQAWETIRAYVLDLEWRDVEEELPPDSYEVVLAIASGSPTENITFDNATVCATYDSISDKWCVEEYPEWENPKISWWMPIPEAPEVSK